MNQTDSTVFEVLQRQGSGTELTFVASFTDFEAAYMFADVKKNMTIVMVKTTREVMI